MSPVRGQTGADDQLKAGTDVDPTSVENAALHIGAPGPAVASESAALLNASLGEGYITAVGLQELGHHEGVLARVRTRRGRLVGAATAAVLTPVHVAVLQDKLRLAGHAGDFLAGRRVGEFKSLAVAPDARGRGIAARMVRACLAFLSTSGCRYAVTASWVSADAAHSSRGLLERAGFEALATIPGYWADHQAAAGYACPDCGGRCRCSAVIMVLDLDLNAAAPGGDA